MARVDREAAVQLMRDANLEPLVPYPGADNKWLCRCLTCGAEVLPRYSSINRGQNGCKPCGNKKTAKALTRSHSDMALELSSMDLIPLEEYPGAHSPWKCQCRRCNEAVSIVIAYVRRRGRSCPKCSVVRRGLESRKSQVLAEQELRTAGYDPKEPYPGGGFLWKCVHQKCGREMHKRLGDVRAGRGRCRYCYTGSFKFDAPAFLYVLRHENFGAVKIGITGAETRRIKSFTNKNWELVEKFQFPFGKDAHRIEQVVLRHIQKDLGLAPYLTSEEIGHLAGYSETFDSEKLSPENLVTLVEKSLEGKIS